MGKENFEKIKLEFMQTILRIERLPRVGEFHFKNGDDQRLWFNKVYKIDNFKDFIDEIKRILRQFGIELLSDEEKEEEFLECIQAINRVPLKDECYFTDNDEMRNWYINYKQEHQDFETKVHDSLREYQEFDLEPIWSNIKTEFITIIKNLKRIPKHGEKMLQDGIDVRTVYDKLETYDPQFVETLLLHLQTYNAKKLSLPERKKEFLREVALLGYIPYLQESRFSDRTDMFTWYTKYKDTIPNLEEEVQSLIENPNPNKEVNIYLIPNFRKSGGKFYTICTNVGERLDLSNINSFEEALQLDSTLVKRGGLILKKDEEIASVRAKKGRSK